MGSILLARDVPETGGDTLFSSQYQAFDTLPDGMKQVLLTMRAEHTSRIAFGGMAPQTEGVAGRIGNADLPSTIDASHHSRRRSDWPSYLGSNAVELDRLFDTSQVMRAKWLDLTRDRWLACREVISDGLGGDY